MDTRPLDKQKLATQHTDAARNFEQAAKHHHDAAKHHQDGVHEKAATSAHMAHGHACHAHEQAKQASKHYAGIEDKQK